MTERTTDRPVFSCCAGLAALSLAAIALAASGCRFLTPQPMMPVAPVAPGGATYPTPAYPSYPAAPGEVQPLYPTPDPAFNAAPNGGPAQTFTARPPGADPGAADQLVPTPVDPPMGLQPEPEPEAAFSGPRLVPPDNLEPLPTDEPRPVDPLDQPRPADRAPADHAPVDRGPSIAIEGIRVPARVELEVSAEPTCQIGADCVFTVTLRSTGDQPTGPLTVEAEFDSALVFPGRTDKRVKRPVTALAAGATETFTLTLRPDSAGVHCARFTVSGEGVTSVTKQICVSCETSGSHAGR